MVLRTDVRKARSQRGAVTENSAQERLEHSSAQGESSPSGPTEVWESNQGQNAARERMAIAHPASGRGLEPRNAAPGTSRIGSVSCKKEFSELPRRTPVPQYGSLLRRYGVSEISIPEITARLAPLAQTQTAAGLQKAVEVLRPVGDFLSPVGGAPLARLESETRLVVPLLDPSVGTACSHVVLLAPGGCEPTVPPDLQARMERLSAAGQAILAGDPRPLTGLHIVLDPGHMGGAWAADTGKRIPLPDGTYVNEGDLNFDLSLRAAERLRTAGARVSLTRDRDAPTSDAARVVDGEIDYSGVEVADYRDELLRRKLALAENAQVAEWVWEQIAAGTTPNPDEMPAKDRFLVTLLLNDSQPPWFRAMAFRNHIELEARRDRIEELDGDVLLAIHFDVHSPKEKIAAQHDKDLVYSQGTKAYAVGNFERKAGLDELSTTSQRLEFLEHALLPMRPVSDALAMGLAEGMGERASVQPDSWHWPGARPVLDEGCPTGLEHRNLHVVRTNPRRPSVLWEVAYYDAAPGQARSPLTLPPGDPAYEAQMNRYADAALSGISSFLEKQADP